MRVAIIISMVAVKFVAQMGAYNVNRDIKWVLMVNVKDVVIKFPIAMSAI